MEREPRALRPVEHLEHAERPLLDQQRDGHDPLRHVAGLLRDLLRMPRILGQILDDERLARDERPAGDAGAGRDPRADQTLLVLAGDGLEDELVGLLVQEEDRGALGREDRPRDLDDRPEQRSVGGIGADHAGRNGGSESVLAHVGGDPPMLSAIRWSTLLSWYGVNSGCLERTSAQIPEMCGVAKLLPVARIVLPPIHASSTSTPRAKNSTGGVGVLEKGAGAGPAGLPAGMTAEKRHG